MLRLTVSICTDQTHDCCIPHAAAGIHLHTHAWLYREHRVAEQESLSSLITAASTMMLLAVICMVMHGARSN